MRKLAGLFVLSIVFVAPVFAQETPPSTGQETPPAAQTPAPAPEEKPKPAVRYTPKYEISAGFSRRSYYSSGVPTIWMNGWDGSIDYNWKNWIGGEAEGLGVYKRLDPNQTLAIYTAMVGPRIYPFGHRKFTVYGHFLYGEGYYRLSTAPIGGFGGSNTTDTHRAWAGGGGFALEKWNHWGIRLFQLDYASTHFLGGKNGQGSIRVSFGVTFRFGQKR